MPGIESARPPFLSSVEAQLYVADVDASCAYFRDQLGFAIAFTYGTPPYYGMVERDRAFIALRKICEPVFVGDIRERQQLLSASITIDTRADIDRIYADYETAGVVFQQQLAVQQWGVCNFVVRDPDGNLILFAGPAK